MKTLKMFKTTKSSLTKSQSTFTNDTQHLHDSTNKLTSLIETGHDMIT